MGRVALLKRNRSTTTTRMHRLAGSPHMLANRENTTPIATATVSQPPVDMPSRTVCLVEETKLTTTVAPKNEFSPFGTEADGTARAQRCMRGSRTA